MKNVHNQRQSHNVEIVSFFPIIRDFSERNEVASKEAPSFFSRKSTAISKRVVIGVNHCSFHLISHPFDLRNYSIVLATLRLYKREPNRKSSALSTAEILNKPL